MLEKGSKQFLLVKEIRYNCDDENLRLIIPSLVSNDWVILSAIAKLRSAFVFIDVICPFPCSVGLVSTLDDIDRRNRTKPLD